MKQTDDKTIADAVRIIEKRFARRRYTIDEPAKAANYLRLKLANMDREEFAVLFLDMKHRVIAAKRLFMGTVRGCMVSPREICREALRHNASAVLLAHNHPSGDPEPSQADVILTHRIIQALEVLDVNVLDHVVVGGADFVSLSDRGMLYRQEAKITRRKKGGRGAAKLRQVAA